MRVIEFSEYWLRTIQLLISQKDAEALKIWLQFDCLEHSLLVKLWS